MSELGPEARALLRATQGVDDPSADDAVRVREKLAVRLSLAAAAGAAATVSSPPTAGAAAANVVTTGSVGTAGTALSTKLFLGAAIAGSTVVAGAVVLGSLPEDPPETPRPRGAEPARRADAAHVESTNTTRAASREPPAPSHPPRALLPPIDGPRREHPPTERSPAVPSGREPNNAHRAGRSPPNEPAPPEVVAPIGDSVADEAALLRSAHAALTRGDGATALRRLDAHAARFPQGALTEERQAARVFALCATGRALDARAAAARFLTARPGSPLAGQVRRTCAERPSESPPPGDDSSTKRPAPNHP